MFIFTGVVNAEGLSFEFKEVNGKVSLSYYFDNELIDYEVAVNDYGVMRYQTFKYNGRDVYFYNGDEIKESAYLKGKAVEDADLRKAKADQLDNQDFDLTDESWQSKPLPSFWAPATILMGTSLDIEYIAGVIPT